MIRGRDLLDSEGELPFRPLVKDATLILPPMTPGLYDLSCIETHHGHPLSDLTIELRAGETRVDLPPFRHDLALAIRPHGPIESADNARHP